MKKNEADNSNNKDNASKIIGMMGFARRAGKITFGFDAVLKDMRDNKIKAVILSCDASQRTTDKILGECKKLGLRSAVLPFDKEKLGRSIGRDDVAVAAVTDKSFADRIIELAKLNESNGGQISKDEGN